MAVKQLSDSHTIPTPALAPTCTDTLYGALPSPEPATDSLTPPVLGAFMGDTLDPENPLYEKNSLADPRPDSTLPTTDSPLPTPEDIRQNTLLSALHRVPQHALLPTPTFTL